MNKSKAVGTQFSSDVIRYLREHGFPHAELRNQAGAFDKGDIVGCPGVAWECKGGHAAEVASDLQVTAWLMETETERVNAKADIGVLVMKRAAIGAKRAGRWWAVMPLWVLRGGPVKGDPLNHLPVRMHLVDAVVVLHELGYGTAAEPPP